MTRTLGLVALVSLALTACGGNNGDESGTPTGTTGGTDACTATVTAFPENGASEVYYRTSVEFTMSAVESDASISLSDGSADVAGSSAVVGDRVVFTPDAPLAPSTTYTATLSWSCGPTEVSWTTSDIGSPADPASLVGKAYSLDLGAGRFVEPPGVGDVIGSFLDTEVLLGVTAADASIVHIMGALGDGAGNQDICEPSFDFPVDADFTENPYFIVESDSLNLDISGVLVTIEDLEVSGAFSANGDQVAGASLRGTLDVSILEELVGSDPCSLLVAFGVSCETCSDGVTETCLSVYVDSMVATEVNGPLEEIDQATADANCP